MSKEYNTFDEYGRSVKIYGQLVAEVTTHTPGRGRWTELRVYEREAGGFVYEQVGCSDYYRAPKESDLEKDVLLRSELPEGAQPLDVSYRGEKVVLEEDRYKIMVFDTVEELVKNGVKSHNGRATAPGAAIIEQLDERYRFLPKQEVIL